MDGQNPISCPLFQVHPYIYIFYGWASECQIVYVISIPLRFLHLSQNKNCVAFFFSHASLSNHVCETKHPLNCPSNFQISLEIKIVLFALFPHFCKLHKWFLLLLFSNGLSSLARAPMSRFFSSSLLIFLY